MSHRRQTAHIDVTDIVLRIERQPVAGESIGIAAFRPPDAKHHADDWLNALGLSRILKWHHTVKTVTVANCYRREAKFFRGFANFLRLDCTLQHSVGRKDA